MRHALTRTYMMTPNIKYEVLARAFELMTGFLAPGKDYPAAYGPVPETVRNETWIEWRDHHRKINAAVLQAVDEIIMHNQD